MKDSKGMKKRTVNQTSHCVYMTPDEKYAIERAAGIENRKVSNYFVHAALSRAKDIHGIEVEGRTNHDLKDLAGS